ncbi:CHY zinc finger protein [Sporosarcina sp. NCCP-2331]|uniref:CHY zinc finger protein n=1 Tax=unclassified Sporosarcina TaxID=2647733 RepID=UPI0035E43000
MEVHGLLIDEETRCVHFHTEADRIAIKFYCCKTYYPCYDCHEETGCGDHAVWPVEQFDEKAVLCGSCGHELTVNEYINSHHRCPSCRSGFNPGCSLHRNLYFAATEPGHSVKKLIEVDPYH